MFHPTARDRFVYLLVLGICVGLVGFCGAMVVRGSTVRIGSWQQALGVSCLLLAGCAYLNWLAYSAFIRVHEGGLEWKDALQAGSLPWADIQGLGFKRYPKFVKPGLVLKSTRELQFLPFFPPALYAVLRERCGRLPAEVERELGFRS